MCLGAVDERANGRAEGGGGDQRPAEGAVAVLGAARERRGGDQGSGARARFGEDDDEDEPKRRHHAGRDQHPSCPAAVDQAPEQRRGRSQADGEGAGDDARGSEGANAWGRERIRR
ncbi:MAG TPA: hypothetical protein VKA35_03905 [Solirubrobacterales bacterium]|nr:hypothetical protein [Solirubrobacterales bacterium]